MHDQSDHHAESTGGATKVSELEVPTGSGDPGPEYTVGFTPCPGVNPGRSPRHGMLGIVEACAFHVVLQSIMARR